MKPQAFQLGELRDEHDQIIRAGSYGKKTPFVSADNNAILDYIMNNFDALYAQIPNGRAYVKSVNNITPDSNGNVTINLGSGGGTGGTNITVDSTLSSASTNPVPNKVIYAALNNKLDKNGTATYAARDSSGNIISSTYVRKTELSGYVKSINNVKPDGAGNVNISTGGTNVTPDLTPYMKKTADSDLMMGVHKLIFGRTVISDDHRNTVPMFTIDATGGRGVNIKGPDVLVNGIHIATETDLSDKLDKTGTADKATRDGAGNVITETYATKADVSGVVKSVNGAKPDSSGNVNISTSGDGGVSLSVENTWTAQQNFQRLKFNFESFATSRISGTYDSPSRSVAAYNVTSALTLDMSTLARMISNGDTSIFTAYIASNGSYALSITNAGTLKHAGSAADLAITASGLLLNIFLTKNVSGVVTSIAQATKLS